MMAAREGSGRIQLPSLDVYRSFDWLRFAPIGYDSRLERDFETPLTIPGRTALPERLLTIEIELSRAPHVYNDGRGECLDWQLCGVFDPGCSLTLRNWRPGDQYQRRGGSGAEKIKTLFQQFRIPLWERRTWPVIARGGCDFLDAEIWRRGRVRRGAGKREHSDGPRSGPVKCSRELMESNSMFPASMQMSITSNNKVRRALRDEQ